MLNVCVQYSRYMVQISRKLLQGIDVEYFSLQGLHDTGHMFSFIPNHLLLISLLPTWVSSGVSGDNATHQSRTWLWTLTKATFMLVWVRHALNLPYDAILGSGTVSRCHTNEINAKTMQPFISVQCVMRLRVNRSEIDSSGCGCDFCSAVELTSAQWVCVMGWF